MLAAAETTADFSLPTNTSGTVDVSLDDAGRTAILSEEPLNICFKLFFVLSTKDRRLFVDASDSQEVDARSGNEACSGQMNRWL